MNITDKNKLSKELSGLGNCQDWMTSRKDRVLACRQRGAGIDLRQSSARRKLSKLQLHQGRSSVASTTLGKVISILTPRSILIPVAAPVLPLVSIPDAYGKSSSNWNR